MTGETTETKATSMKSLYVQGVHEAAQDWARITCKVCIVFILTMIWFNATMEPDQQISAWVQEDVLLGVVPRWFLILIASAVF